jgi:mRNA export factor
MSGLFGSSSAASTPSVGDLKSDIALSDPPTDTISALSFSPAQNGPDFLAISSWDNKVRIYEIAQNGQSQGRHAFEHTQPVLDCDFSKVWVCLPSNKKRDKAIL